MAFSQCSIPTREKPSRTCAQNRGSLWSWPHSGVSSYHFSLFCRDSERHSTQKVEAKRRRHQREQPVKEPRDDSEKWVWRRNQHPQNILKVFKSKRLNSVNKKKRLKCHTCLLSSYTCTHPHLSPLPQMFLIQKFSAVHKENHLRKVPAIVNTFLPLFESGWWSFSLDSSS